VLPFSGAAAIAVQSDSKDSDCKQRWGDRRARPLFWLLLS